MHILTPIIIYITELNIYKYVLAGPFTHIIRKEVVYK